jgi:acyl-ACP thioesterase
MASLMQCLQEVAALHAEQLGLGFERLGRMNGYWVLSNLRLEITRLPKWGEEVTVETWPSGYNRVIASREFVGKDRHNRELFKAGSEWMVLNKQTNRLKNLFRMNLNLPKTGQKVLSGALSRLQPPNGCRHIDRVCVPYSSIDLNGHVNNTEYVRWGFDALRKAFKAVGDVRCMQVTYLSEIFEGDELDLSVSSGAGGQFHVLGRKPDTETDVYVMQVVY